MRNRETPIVIAATSPTMLGTAIGAPVSSSWFSRADELVIDAALAAPASGALDVYLQQNVAPNQWLDVAHWALTAGQTKSFTATMTGKSSGTIYAVGGGDDVSASPALAAGTIVDGPIVGPIRVVFVAGSGTSAGAAQSITITPLTTRQ